MNSKIIAGVGLSLVVASCGFAGKGAQESTWMAGFWHLTADEDNSPLGSVMEFRSDGTYIGYDRACKPLGELDYHVHHGEIYVTSEIPGKGPIAVVFHPSPDRSKLTFTSSRTRNNAIYERVPGNKCVARN